MMTQDEMKQAAAQAAIEYIKDHTIIGVGTGTTTNKFIALLATIKNQLEGAVASSAATAQLLKELGIRVFDLNAVDSIPVYIDGADEINSHFELIKGGGGALTREKILACAAQQFICIADQTKSVDMLGAFPLPVEVIPMARSYVAREIVKLGGHPVYREGFTTDNGNIILDIHNLTINQPIKLEQQLNNITGVVTNGLFAKRVADIVLLGTATGVTTHTR